VTTLKKLLSNRRNAQKSSGPASPEGKAIVSQNRTVHGLTGRFGVLAGEDQGQYDRLMDKFMIDENPVGIAEIELVKKMVESLWLTKRGRRLQEGCFLVKEQTADQEANNIAELRVRPELERYLRYQAHHDRVYARAANELLRRRKERLAAERGFESQKRAEAEEIRRETRHVQANETWKYRHATAEQRYEQAVIRTDLMKRAAGAAAKVTETTQSEAIAA
jgi:hypothetical protein